MGRDLLEDQIECLILKSLGKALVIRVCATLRSLVYSGKENINLGEQFGFSYEFSIAWPSPCTPANRKRRYGVLRTKE